jgi:hypothetical protein
VRNAESLVLQPGYKRIGAGGVGAVFLLLFIDWDHLALGHTIFQLLLKSFGRGKQEMQIHHLRAMFRLGRTDDQPLCSQPRISRQGHDAVREHLSTRHLTIS